MSENSIPLNVNIDPDEMKKVIKKYKKLKKYMKSPLFEIKKMDDNEKVISKLLKGVEDLADDTETKIDS
jgi:phosphopantothenate synthetase|tara:strand:- start:1740 stop:1946 length:207 start_codon:yes stop_codon:yes gene_type:complete